MLLFYLGEVTVEKMLRVYERRGRLSLGVNHVL